MPNGGAAAVLPLGVVAAALVLAAFAVVDVVEVLGDDELPHAARPPQASSSIGTIAMAAGLRRLKLR